MDIDIEIALEEKKWGEHPEIDENLIKNICMRVLQRFHDFTKISSFELSVLLTHDSKMSKLNQEFRGKNKPTNVLSFPEEDLESKENQDYMYLGDVAFSYETIQRESIEQNKEFLDHFSHLLVHSILHLIGYDHETDDDAEKMESLEVEILNELGINSPY